MNDISKEAIAYFDTHLVDDPLTARMLSRLDLVADELDEAGLAGVINAVKCARALELGDANSLADLPFEVDRATREIIDGGQSRPAMEEHCTSAQTRQAAAVLNTIGRSSRAKKSYAWADELLRESPLKTYAQVALTVADDALAEVAVVLDHELRMLPRLDTQPARDDDREHQVVLVAALAIFWAETGQVHCGVSDSHSARWARVVRFARERGYPVHDGFQGDVLDDEQLDEVLDGIGA